MNDRLKLMLLSRVAYASDPINVPSASSTMDRAVRSRKAEAFQLTVKWASQHNRLGKARRAPLAPSSLYLRHQLYSGCGRFANRAACVKVQKGSDCSP